MLKNKLWRNKSFQNVLLVNYLQNCGCPNLARNKNFGRRIGQTLVWLGKVFESILNLSEFCWSRLNLYSRTSTFSPFQHCHFFPGIALWVHLRPILLAFVLQRAVHGRHADRLLLHRIDLGSLRTEERAQRLRHPRQRSRHVDGVRRRQPDGVRLSQVSYRNGRHGKGVSDYRR